MDACHLLLGRPWQHGVDATHEGKANLYSFQWKKKRIIIPPLPPLSKTTKADKEEESTKIFSLCKRGEFLFESKETRQQFALVVKEEVAPPIDIPEEMKPVLEEFKRILPPELPDGLPPMRDIQHHIDVILGASLPLSSSLPHEPQRERRAQEAS